MVVMRPVKLERLLNSCDASAVPDTAAYEMSNASFVDGVIAGGERMGDLWARASAHASDLGLGLGYAEFEGAEEYLVILRRNGEVTARLSSVNPSTGVFTAVTTGTVNAQSLPADGFYMMRQALGYVYILHVGTSTTMWRRAVGDLATGAAFELFEPVYNRGYGFGPRVAQPPYEQCAFGKATLCDPDGSGVELTLIGTSTFRLNFPGATGPADIYVAVDSQTGWDLTNVDVLHEICTIGLGPIDRKIVCAIALSEDNESTVDNDFVQSLTFIDNGDPTLTSGGALVTGGVYENTRIITSHMPTKRSSRRIIKRIVFRFLGTGGGSLTPGAAAYDFTLLEFGGVRTWDITAPSAGTEIGYAVRWAKKKTGTFTYTQLTRMPDLLVRSAGTDGEDMLGQLPVTAKPYMGSKVEVSVPYDPVKANEGYDTVQFFRQESATSGNWYKVAETKHEGQAGTLITVVDSTLQSVVDAGGSAASPGGEGPSTDADCIGVWKDHFVIGVDHLALLSTAGLPGEFVPPVDEIAGYYDPNQDTLGATFYVGKGRTTGAIAIAGTDTLFVGTARQVLGVIGDSAFASTPPRPAPGSFGLTSARCFFDYATGVLASHIEGLYYYDSNRLAQSFTDNLMAGEEFTQLVRKSWKRLLAGGTGTGMVGVYGNDSVWVFNKVGSDTRFLRITRPVPMRQGERLVEEGTWPFGVVDAVTVPGRGTRILLSNGTVARLGTDATGTAYVTDNGTAATWSVTTGERIANREQITSIFAKTTGDSGHKVTIKVYVDDGVKTAGLLALQQTLTCEPGTDWIARVNIRPGTRFQLVIEGSVQHNKVLELVLGVEDRGRGDGN